MGLINRLYKNSKKCIKIYKKMYCKDNCICYNNNMDKIIKNNIKIDKKIFEKFSKIGKLIPIEVLTGFFKCTLAQLQTFCKQTYGCSLYEKIKTSGKTLKKIPAFNEENFELFTLANQVSILADQKTYCIDKYVDFFSMGAPDIIEDACKEKFAGRTFRQSVDSCIYYDRMNIYENLRIRRNESPNLLKHMAECCLELRVMANENVEEMFKANAYVALNKFWDTGKPSKNDKNKDKEDKSG